MATTHGTTGIKQWQDLVLKIYSIRAAGLLTACWRRFNNLYRDIMFAGYQYDQEKNDPEDLQQF